MRSYFKKTILISGYTGFVGKNIVKLLKQKYNLLTIDRKDLNELISSKNFEISSNKIDAIIHCAAAVSVPESYKNPFYFFDFNINSTLALANLGLKYGIKKFIYLNTYGYGNEEKNPIDEKSEIIPHSPYTKSKYLAEKLLFNFFTNETNVVSLRIFNLYGLFQPKTFLIPSMIEQGLNSNIIKVNNSLTKRDYVYILDLIDLIERAIETPNANGVYNVGTGESYGTDFINECLSKILNKKIKLKSENINRSNEIVNCYANNKKAIKELKWEIKYNLYNGLKDLILNK